MWRMLLTGVLAACASAVAAPAAWAGDVKGLGAKYVQAISGDGSTVVGYDATDSFTANRRPWRWTSAEGKVLLTDGSRTIQNSYPTGVSYDGSALALIINSTSRDYDAARWTAPSGVQVLGEGAAAFGISPDGSFVSGLDENHRATLWSVGSGGVRQAPLPGEVFAARAVGTGGQVVVGASVHVEGLNHAVRWIGEERRMEVLDLPPGRRSADVFAVSADGTAIFGMSWGGGRDEAWRWTEAEGTVTLGDPQGWSFSSAALDATADGRTAVGIGVAGEEVRPFIWDSLHGIRDLERAMVEEWGMDLAGWRLTDGKWDMFVGISDDGRTLTGVGVNPQGRTESWIVAIPVPEPSSVGVLCVAAAGLLRRRRGRSC